MSERELRDLPGLLEWGDALHQATQEAETAPRRARWRRRVPARRLGVATAVLLLAVPGAVATRSVWDDPITRVDPGAPGERSPVARLADGTTRGVTWRLGGYDAAGGRRCLRFTATPAGAPVRGATCAVPLPGAGLIVTATPVGDLLFVVGTAGADVRDVAVAVGGATARVATEPVPGDVLRRSGMRGGFRTYVAVLTPGGAGPAAGAPHVTAYDAGGRVLGTNAPAAG